MALTPQPTLAGQALPRPQGVHLNHTTGAGVTLITRYQNLYGLCVVLGDGVAPGDCIALVMSAT